MKLKTLFIILTLIVFVSLVGSSQAQTTDDYTWQYLVPQTVTGAEDLQTLLAQEVRKIVAAGHLAPFRALYGEGPRHFFWYQRFDVVYALSLAYPYLPADVQSQVKTYLKSEMQQYPLWSGDLLPANVGTRREPDEISDAERGGLPQVYSQRPKLFSLYALWLYAQQTGDWQYIAQNWPAIVSFYNANRGEVSRHYQSLAGAIGMARMAALKPSPDTQMQATATADITAGFNAGTNFTQFAKNASASYLWQDNGLAWTVGYTFEGFQYLNLTPEIGRFMNANAAVKAAVLGNTAQDIYSLKRGEYLYPLWYMAQAPGFSRYFGEGSAIAPDAKAMIFPIKAWVQQQPAATLRLYVDAPDALVGDFYYLQGLVYTIQAHGQACWENLRTANAECAGTAPPPTAPPLTLTPSPTATITTVPPTATFTPTATSLPPTVVPTATSTSVPAQPTATLTNTPPPPSLTPSLTPTFLPEQPTATMTAEPTLIPPPSDNPAVYVNLAVSGNTVEVMFDAVNVVNLYGLQAVCAVDPALLQGVTHVGGEGFNDSNSFFVDPGFSTDGRWVIGVTRVRPNAPITGSLPAFRLLYTLLQPVTAAVDCVVEAVDINGYTLPLEVVGGGSVTPPVTPTPTLTPDVPTPVPGGLSVISGAVAFPGRNDHAGITVALAVLDTPLASVTTTSTGQYRFTEVPTGVYFLRVSAPGALMIEHQILIDMDGKVLDLGTDLLPMGDTDGNALVDVVDAAFIGANYGADGSLVPTGDLNQDSRVNINDLVLVGNSFGLTSPIVIMNLP